MTLINFWFRYKISSSNEQHLIKILINFLISKQIKHLTAVTITCELLNKYQIDRSKFKITVKKAIKSVIKVVEKPKKEKLLKN